MRNVLFFIVFLSLLIIAPVKIYADEVCSKNGYTILTINGMLSSRVEAIRVKDSLKKQISNINKNEPLTVDYLYNPSHLGGIGDTVDILAQGLLNYKNDYDLTEILKDASEKIETQKVLLVAHSQGNFYANNLYDKVVDVSGGIPSESIQVYGVGSPDNRVAGNGKYLNSDTDWTINKLAKNFLIDILPPNVHITLNKNDGDGHSFSDVYMKYQGDRIVSDVQSLLNKIKSNDIQNINELCIATPKISIAHNGLKVVLAVADPIASIGNYITNGVERASSFVGRNISRLLASAGGILGDTNEVSIPQNEEPVLEADETSPIAIPNPILTQTEITQETIKENTDDSSNGNENSIEEILSTTPVDSEDTTKKHNSGGGGGSSTPEPPTCSDSQTLVDGICVLKQSEENPVPSVTTVDTIAPVISLVGESSLDIVKDSVYEDLGATAFDEVDEDLTEAVVKSGTFVNTSIIGSYTIIYTVSDLSNNSSTLTRTINIIAPEPPVEDDEEENNEEEGEVVENNFIIDEDTILTYGEYNYDNLHITNNAKLLLESNPDSADAFKGVKITAKNITIDSGSYISADGKGYTDGPGAPIPTENDAGATYGGRGEKNKSVPIYGKATEPIELGSGGYNYWRGGGAIRLIVANTLLNNGVISANGDTTSSGGSIYVTAKNISGNGTFNANGGGQHAGSGFFGSGGGGRIALYYEGLLFTGKAKALGGCGSYSDGYTQVCAENGTVGFFDTLNNNLLVNSSWLFQENDNPFNFNQISFTDGAIVTSEEGTTINANELVIDGTSQFTLSKDQIINIPTISLDDSSKITFSGEENLTTDTITIAGNSTITIIPEQILSLTLSNLTIESGSSISADGKGYVDGLGASIVYTGGASYGGIGGSNTSSSVYGNEMEPIDFGSGGANNFRGGGAIRIITTDTILNNGVISAGGDVTSSGGSIYITTKNLSGNGYIWANGGGPNSSGVFFSPGGGGRIAIYYENNSFIEGHISADGSNSSNGISTAGTIKLIDTTISTSSSEKLITTFNFEGLDPIVTGAINETNHTVSLTVPYGTEILNLVPKISISEESSVMPASGESQNFTNPVTYTVTAEDSTTQTYTVSVFVSENSNQEDEDTDDTSMPTITSYSFNGNQSDITINPLLQDISIVLTANKNVNWMYIDIEKEDETTRHKFFLAGEVCKDASSCTKIWKDGLLSEGGLLISGNYKVWVHIKDSQGQEYEGYLPSKIIVNIE